MTLFNAGFESEWNSNRQEYGNLVNRARFALNQGVVDFLEHQIDSMTFTVYGMMKYQN
jgi:hypothetical protein